MAQVLCRRPAMATLFEFLLIGDDEEHLTAVGEAALDEVERVERMLSMFDPASELTRVNREAYSKTICISRELFAILKDCRWYYERFEGFFDPCHGGPLPYGKALRIIDESTCRIRLNDPDSRIDLGGFGKGYALDAAEQVFERFEVEDYLLHGGTSSVLAFGDRRWPIDLRSPDGKRTLGQVHLRYDSLSCSANGTVGTAVLAESAEVAEVYSTAILAAGRERMNNFNYDNITAAAWLDSDIHWIVDRRK